MNGGGASPPTTFSSAFQGGKLPPLGSPYTRTINVHTARSKRNPPLPDGATKIPIVVTFPCPSLASTAHLTALIGVIGWHVEKTLPSIGSLPPGFVHMEKDDCAADTCQMNECCHSRTPYRWNSDGRTSHRNHHTWQKNYVCSRGGRLGNLQNGILPPRPLSEKSHSEPAVILQNAPPIHSLSEPCIGHRRFRTIAASIVKSSILDQTDRLSLQPDPNKVILGRPHRDPV